MIPNLELEALQVKGKVLISSFLRWKAYETSYFSGVEGFAGKWWLFSVIWDSVSGTRHPQGPYKAETRLPGGPQYVGHYKTVPEGQEACQRMWEYWLIKSQEPPKPKPRLAPVLAKPILPSQKTVWFSVLTTPSLQGWYEVKFRGADKTTLVFWDTKKWSRSSFGYPSPNDLWRGLLKKGSQ